MLSLATCSLAMTETHLAALLDRILALEQLTAVFQPIVSLSKQNIFGYEGLIRGPTDSLLYRPQVLFAVAARCQRLAEMDLLSRRIVIRQFCKLKLPGRLFININPTTLGQDDDVYDQTLTYLEDQALKPARVVVEITEAQPIDDPAQLQQALKQYRALGFQIALDDLGTGVSGLKLWSELNPDFVKIDRHFIQGVDEDKIKRQFIASILEIAKGLGCQTITEGIETKSQYATLRKLGVQLAQGHYFDQPLATPNIQTSPRLFSKRPYRGRRETRLTAGCLLKPTPTVAVMARAGEIGELFQGCPELRSVAVVDDERPVGLIFRDELMHLLPVTDGCDTPAHKGISSLIQPHALIFEKDTPLEEISKRLTAAPVPYPEEFIITEQGKFLGKGTLLDLLRKITDLRVNTVRYANPLTLLPGDVLIRQALEDHLGLPLEFSLACCGLNHFKAYNETYGYGRGDEILQLLGRLLRETVDPDQDFIGHLGGDDFIVIYRSSDWGERCQNLLQTFQAIIGDCYGAADRQQGGIETIDCYGVKHHFPIMSLSIGILALRPPHHHLTVARILELADAAVKKAKRNGSQYVCVEIHDPRDLFTPEPIDRAEALKNPRDELVMVNSSC